MDVWCLDILTLENVYSWTCQLAPIIILSMHDKKKEVHELAIEMNCCSAPDVSQLLIY